MIAPFLFTDSFNINIGLAVCGLLAVEDTVYAVTLDVFYNRVVRKLQFPNNSIEETFDIYQYNLRRVFKRVPIYDDMSRQLGQISILLSSAALGMAIYVTGWLDKPKQVDEHIQRMHLIRQYPPAEVKGKKLYGSMAGAVVDPAVREYAEQSGFFVLDLAGNDIQRSDRACAPLFFLVI